jgi:hypothetical protein
VCLIYRFHDRSPSSSSLSYPALADAGSLRPPVDAAERAVVAVAEGTLGAGVSGIHPIFSGVVAFGT